MRPSFQFYPGDWTGNSNLRRCSFAEKGAWIEVMCLMHDQEDYGVLRWPLKDIAQAAGCTLAHLKGLVAKGVLKGSDATITEPFTYIPRSGRRNGDPVELIPIQNGPVWYCSRMVKDEYVRTIRGESSRFGEGNDAAPKAAPDNAPKQSSSRAPKPPFGDGSSSSSSSSSSIEEKITTPPTPRSRGKAFDACGIELPSWLGQEDWQAWVADRKDRGKPITKQAAVLQVKQLEKYRCQGFSPHDVIAHSIAGGYQGLFPANSRIASSPSPGPGSSGGSPGLNRQEALEKRNLEIGRQWAQGRT